MGAKQAVYRKYTARVFRLQRDEPLHYTRTPAQGQRREEFKSNYSTLCHRRRTCFPKLTLLFSYICIYTACECVYIRTDERMDGLCAHALVVVYSGTNNGSRERERPVGSYFSLNPRVFARKREAQGGQLGGSNAIGVALILSSFSLCR